MNNKSTMPSTRFGGIIKLIGIFAIQVGLIVALHYVGSFENMTVNFKDFSQWLNTTPPEVALVASIRILALCLSYWLVLTSFIYMFARALNIRILIHALELTTIPGVRRMIDAGLAAAIIGGTVFGGAGAVFAKSAQAQVQGVAASVSANVKDSRVLYNPQPAGNAVNNGPSVSLTNEVAAPVDAVDVAQPQNVKASPNVKTVVDSSAQDTSISTPPRQDDRGNFIPTPAGGGGLSSENTSGSNKETSQKSVIDPTPAEGSTTTTSPKVVVTPTSPPVVSTPVTPTVQVQGQQVQRPNETPNQQVPASDSYTVVSGDNFWNIAKHHLRNNIGHEPTDGEVASYWVKLIDANRQTIRSGDPDLIFPGEVFTLPPV